MEPAAKAEDKTERKPAAKVEDKPEPAVISAGTERVDEDFIQYLRTRPVRRPSPLPEILRNSRPWLAECSQTTDAMINETEDLYEDILRQHDEKGYALVRVERLDNGKKRLYRLPEEETA